MKGEVLVMDKCDICSKAAEHKALEKIEVDWDGRYKMVCQGCIAERGRHAILCRFDRPRQLQDKDYDGGNGWKPQE